MVKNGYAAPLQCCGHTHTSTQHCCYSAPTCHGLLLRRVHQRVPHARREVLVNSLQVTAAGRAHTMLSHRAPHLAGQGDPVGLTSPWPPGFVRTDITLWLGEGTRTLAHTHTHTHTHTHAHLHTHTRTHTRITQAHTHTQCTHHAK